MKKIFLFSLLLFALILFNFCSTAQSIIYVSPNGSGMQNGTSWSNAYSASSLRQVLRQSPESAQVWVAAGIYKPHSTSRDSSFFIRSNLKVYGGFAGNEIMLNQRNYTNNVTVLSGNIGNQNDSLDNSYHVVYFENAKDSTLLDGFTITEGSALKGPFYPLDIKALGAGILNRSFVPPGGTGLEMSSPTIKNCIIKNNHGMRGSGLCEYGTARLFTKVINCIFENNSATDQGGAYSLEASSTASLSNVIINDCKFINNRIDNSVFFISHRLHGGAISLIKGNLKISNSLFENNNAPTAAVLHALNGITSVELDSCLIRNNLTHQGPLIQTMTNSIFRNSTFEQNPNGLTGSSVIQILSNFGNRTKNEITNCTFRDNFLPQSSYPAYTIIIRVAALSPNGETAIDTTRITNCLFYNTQKSSCISSYASPGGRANTYITNSTFYTNLFGTNKGQVHNAAISQASDPSGPSIANMTINNSILYYPPNHSFDTVMSQSVINEIQGPLSTANTLVSNSLIRSKNNNWPVDAGMNGGGNIINADPGFIDSVNRNFRLTCNSIALNAGNNSLFTLPFSTDLDGNQRIFGSAIDMGCYEQGNLDFDINPSVTKNGLEINYNLTCNIAIDSVRWTFGDNNFTTSTAGNHTYTTFGTKQVCAKAYTVCGTKDTCFNINICADPIPNFIYLGNVQNNVAFTYTGHTSPSVTWDFGDGSTTDGNAPTHQYTASGNYLVCVTASKMNCENTYCKVIISDSTSNNTRIKDLGNAPDLTLYPNPADNSIQFAGSETILSAVIYHTTGQVALTQTFNHKDNSPPLVDISRLTPGVYFVKAIITGERHQVFKIIKQ